LNSRPWRFAGSAAEEWGPIRSAYRFPVPCLGANPYSAVTGPAWVQEAQPHGLPRLVVVDTKTMWRSRSTRPNARKHWPSGVWTSPTRRSYSRGLPLEVEDLRADYGETRVICYGLLEGRMVVVGYTPRGADSHVFSMRKANEREKARITPLLEV